MKSYYEKIPLTQILEPICPSRSEIDAAGIEELAESLKSRGLLQPILLTKRGDNYEIEAGHRRFLAANLLNWGSISAFVITDEDDEELHLARAHENLIRQDLNPVDEARLVHKLVYEDARGVEATSKLLSKKPGWVEARMEVLRWPAEIITAIEQGKINMAVGKELNKCRESEVMLRLLDSAIQYGVPGTIVKQWVDDTDISRRLSSPQVDGEGGDVASLPINPVHMECRVCAVTNPLSIMRHIWLCPDCLIAIRHLSRELKTEIENNRAAADAQN